MDHACPLCQSSLSPFVTVATGKKQGRRPLAFLECPACRLVVRDPASWPDREAERAHYMLHENDPDDPGYRRFLSPAFERIRPRLSPGVRGLDFGCGPDSAIAVQAAEVGVPMAVFDPLFHPDEAVLRDGDYDVISCTETVEHLHRPMTVMARLERLLRPGGRLVIQTGFVPGAEAFAGWHYWRDPTHVILFRAETFRWLAASRGWWVVEIESPVAVFEMPEKEGNA
ncbi:MAG: class I SAM-dependent methyltransferase [Guyparkeria sp.]|uniref:class I SAM-dependent methyltransferase n=1 Tax=Guyparkeria sp. TaxID=2035736 RepID=UPI00397E2032